MPRRARITLAGVPHHLIQRGNNRADCFNTESDFKIYLSWLGEYAEQHGCDVHAYALMTNHVHLLVTPSDEQALGRLMKSLGQRYVQYVNRTYSRTGTLWEGRFKSCIVSDSEYLLTCYRYIEMNPVRAGMVDHPAKYRWSSFHANALNKFDPLITAHELYQQLGDSPEIRCANYRTLLEAELNESTLREIRSATNGNFVLGSSLFREKVAQATGCRVSPGKPGRPKTGDRPRFSRVND